jgi:hypothetical protein
MPYCARICYHKPLASINNCIGRDLFGLLLHFLCSLIVTNVTTYLISFLLWLSVGFMTLFSLLCLLLSSYTIMWFLSLPLIVSSSPLCLWIYLMSTMFLIIMVLLGYVGCIGVGSITYLFVLSLNLVGPNHHSTQDGGSLAGGVCASQTLRCCGLSQSCLVCFHGHSPPCVPVYNIHEDMSCLYVVLWFPIHRCYTRSNCHVFARIGCTVPSPR